jgi:hypothetical protein
MFEKVNQIAEQSARHVSRRQFLGRFGSGAAAVSAFVAAVLVHGVPARAGKTVRYCSSNSTSSCAGQPLGSKCGGGAAKCVLLDPTDKSLEPDCICGKRKGSGGKGGKRRGGGGR